MVGRKWDGPSGKAYEKPDFVHLQTEWYKKLADSGFHDIEYRNKDSGSQDDGFLKSGWVETLRRVVNGQLKGGEEYYRLAGWWLYDYPWASRRLRLAWVLTSRDGWTVKQTGARLGKNMTASFHRLKKAMAQHYTVDTYAKAPNEWDYYPW